MHRVLLSAILAGMFIVSLLSAADKRATTEDGKVVILRDDGTWVYAEKDKSTKGGKEKKSAGEHKKAKDAVLAYKGKHGTFAMYLSPNVWKKTEKPSSAAAEVEFKHKDGDVMAMIIAERIKIPLNALKDGAIKNMRAVDKNAKVVSEEKRTVNGKEVLSMTLSVNENGAGLTFNGYYYTGDEGSIQILTWTGNNLLKEYKADMEAFLNGFEVIKKKD